MTPGTLHSANLTADAVRAGVERARRELLGGGRDGGRPLVDLPDATAAAIEGGLGVLDRRAEDVAKAGREGLMLAVRWVAVDQPGEALLRLAESTGAQGFARRLAARRGALDAAREARRREEEWLESVVELATEFVIAAAKAAIPVLVEALA